MFSQQARPWGPPSLRKRISRGGPEALAQPVRCVPGGGHPGTRRDRPCGACADGRGLESHSPTAHRTTPTKTRCTGQGKCKPAGSGSCCIGGADWTPAQQVNTRVGRREHKGQRPSPPFGRQCPDARGVSAGNRCPRQGLGHAGGLPEAAHATRCPPCSALGRTAVTLAARAPAELAEPWAGAASGLLA